MEYVVLINGPKGMPLFLVEDDDEAVMFKSFALAVIAAEHNVLAAARGYQIVEWEYFEG